MIKIMPHIGLGDFICLTPLILKLADGKECTVLCWQHNLFSVESFFVNHKNIHLQPVSNESEVHDFYTQKDVLKLGVYNPSVPPKENEDYITWIHRQVGLNEIVYDDTIQVASDIIEPIEPINKPFEEYAFKHDDEIRGFKIDDKFIHSNFVFQKVIPDKLKSILQYRIVIKWAKEIHVIDSSFLHLSEALPTTGKLFFHKYARDGGSLSNYKFRKQWEVLNA